MTVFMLDLWGCMPEVSKTCIDMSNAASTYLGIVAGAAIGGVVSWWIYNRQKKTSEEQDHILCKIKDLEENHTDILKKIKEFDDRHETSLDGIQEINKKLDNILEKKD